MVWGQAAPGFGFLRHPLDASEAHGIATEEDRAKQRGKPTHGMQMVGSVSKKAVLSTY